MLIFEISSYIKYVYINNIKINIEQLTIVLVLFLSDNSFLKFNENMIAFVKSNIVNSARLPRLNESLQSVFRHEFPKRLDVEMNKLFCRNIMIR